MSSLNNMYFCVVFYWCYIINVLQFVLAVTAHQYLHLCFLTIFIFSTVKPMQTLFDQTVVYMFCPILFPWHGSSHSRQHWSDLLEMNGLITASERRRNTVWRGDEWNWGLGLRKPLRQIEGINDCNTARGPQRPTPSSLALWLCNGFPWLLFSGIGRATAFSDTVADRMFFSTPLCLYKVSKRVLSETTKTTCTTLLRHDDPKPPEMQSGILKSLIRYIWRGTLMSNAI